MTSSWPSYSWPIGTRVRWRPEIWAKGDWVGEVTGHPHPRMVEVTGYPAVSLGLLEKVGEMASMVAQIDMDAALAAEVARIQAENDALAGVVAAQMDAIDDAQKRTAAADETEGLVSDLCLALGYGRHPIVPTGLRELDALVAHVLG